MMSSIIAASVLTFNYVNVPHTEMREKPDQDSEVVSEAYYSEQIEVINTDGEWAQIQTNVDKYKGWVKKTTLYEKNTTYPAQDSKVVAKVKELVGFIHKEPDTIFGPSLRLPFESRLEVLDSSDNRWIKVKLVDDKIAYIDRRDIDLEPKKLNLEEMCDFSKNFLKVHYFWGGRCSFGYDCSGFVQMLLRQMDILIPRDSKDQFKWEGFQDIELKDIRRGDLIYWGLDETKIRHTALYLGNNEFIHATTSMAMPNVQIGVSNITESEWNGSGRYKFVSAKRLK